MKHFASPGFWKSCHELPDEVQRLAERSFEMLKRDPRHPSLHLKKTGRYTSARVGLHYRALAVDAPDGLLWIWIGPHAEYDKIVG